MMKRMDKLLDDFDYPHVCIFSTKNQRKVTDNYFYESAEKIYFFFEGIILYSIQFVFIVIILLLSEKSYNLKQKKAFGDDGNLKKSKKLSINKVGKGMLFEICRCFRCFLMLYNASASGVSLQ
ncbi:hypothetical protein NC652_021428 [Populus alba x Populus x berolinensis]|nr:hypothetical protein NC652_021428 [Populus alba x Populus x berolinensis]